MRRRLRIGERLEGHELVLGLLVLAVAALISYVSIIAINGVPFSQSFRFRAEVPANAPLLKDGDEVRIAGQRVGQVRGVAVGPNGGTLLTLDVDKPPIGRDARAVVRQRGLAGATYVEIERGDVRRPMPANGLIPLTRSATGLQLGDVLGAFDPPTARGVRAALGGFGTGFAARGRDLNRALGDLAPALSDSVPILRAVRPAPGAFADMLDGLHRTARGFATPGGRDLAGLLPPASATLATFAERSAALQSTIDLMRPVGDEAAATLPLADVLLDRAAPAVRALAPGIRALARALPDADRLLTRRAGLAAISALARRATPVLREAAPLLRDLAPAAGSLAPLAAPLQTLSAYLAPYKEDLFLGPYGFTQWGKFTYDNGQAAGARAVRFAPVFTCMRARDPYPAPGAALKDEQPCRG